MKFAFITALLACTFTLTAQESAVGTISLQVQNEQHAALEAATVELLKSTDSSVVKLAVTDKEGTAFFENLPQGGYLARVSLVNFQPGFSEHLSLAGGQSLASAHPVVLHAAETELGKVTVTAKKPFIQKLNDRLVINVESSIVSAGSSAMEVLERAPGVNVDQNDLIALKGRQGVIIMIDGKRTAMSGADLANYLRGLPATTIERIDIITNPSAKYDAAGNSGIIDIHMKKDQRMGVNGTVTGGYGQGIYPKANGGTTFNYRNKEMNVFGNYNYAYRVGLNHLLLDRNFYENGVYNGGDLKDNYSKSPFNSNTTRLGMDFFPSKRTIVGFVVNGNFNHYERDNNNNSIVMDARKQRVNTFHSRATNNDHANNVLGNINFKHSFDSVGRELTADADYGVYKSTSLTENATRYFALDGSPSQPNYTLDGDQSGKLTFKTAKIDYVNPLKGSARLEAGLKTSFVSSDNDARFFDVSDGTPKNDVNKTNHFLYHENNNAAYVNYFKEFKKFNIQLGLRGEQTNLNTEQKIGNVKFDSSYFQLFPSAFLNYKIKEDKTIGLSVTRRIDRPGYSDLNPFLFLIDVTTYATGRPELMPQITWSFELTYTLKSLNFSASYSHTLHNQNIAIARFRDVFPNIPSDENVTVQIPVNLASSDYAGLSVSAPLRVTKWWNIINNADIYYEKFNGDLGGTELHKGRPVADIRTNNSFTLKKGWAAELNATLNTGGQYGFMVFDPQWGLSAGVQKTILQARGTVRLNVTDIFWTNLPKAVITYDNYIEKWHAYRETRVVNLSFTYRFGNSKVQAARRRSTASEEELRRAN